LDLNTLKRIVVFYDFGRIAHHNGIIGDVFNDDGARANGCPFANGDAWNYTGANANKPRMVSSM
jgi:hypothetical protein